MSKKRPSKPAPESTAPFGTQTPRPRWALALWIVLCAAWLIVLAGLALRDSLRP